MEDKQKRGRRAKNAAKDIQALRDNMGADGGSGFGVQILSFIIILLFIAIAGFWFLRADKITTPVLIYNNGLSVSDTQGELGWIAEATEQALISLLDAGDNTHIVGSETIGGSKRAPEASGGFGIAQYVLSGSFANDASNPDILNLVLHLKSTDNAGRTYSGQLTGVKTGLNDLSARAAAQIYTWLDQQPLTLNQRTTAAAELPENRDAQEAYALGSSALWNGDARLAITNFEKSLELGGDHPMVYAGLSRAWTYLGYRANSKLTIKKAYETRTNLSRQRQLEIEALYLQSSRQAKRAREIYTALKEFHPHNIHYRLKIASIFNLGGKPGMALQALEEAQDLPAPFKDDPRIDLELARTWYQIGDFAKGNEAATQAMEKARASGDKAILAEALLNWENIENMQSIKHLLEARALFEELGNPDKQAAILTELGNHERNAGNLSEAENYYLEAIAVSQKTGNEQRVTFAQNPLALVMDLKGDLKEGLMLKREVLAYYAARNVKSRQSIMLENVSISLYKLGRLDKSEEVLQQAHDMFELIGDTIGIAWNPYYHARISARRGDLSRALEFAQQALKNSKKNPEGGLEVDTRFEIALIKFWQGENDEAKPEFETLIKAYEKLNNMISVGEAEHMLARIALGDSDYKTARRLLDVAQNRFETSGANYYILDTQTTRVDLMFLGFQGEYEAACIKLGSLLKGAQYTELKLKARVRHVRCKTEAGQQSLDVAIAELQTIASRAKELGLFEPQLDAARMSTRLWENAGQQTFAGQARTRARNLAASKGWAFK